MSAKPILISLMFLCAVFIGAAVGAVQTSGNGAGTITSRAGGVTITNVTSSASSVVILVANLGRSSYHICNNSTKDLALSEITPATFDNEFEVLAGAPSSGTHNCYERIINMYTGTIYGIWASANGDASVTEEH